MLKKLAFGGLGLVLLATPFLASAQAANNSLASTQLLRELIQNLPEDLYQRLVQSMSVQTAALIVPLRQRVTQPSTQTPSNTGVATPVSTNRGSFTLQSNFFKNDSEAINMASGRTTQLTFPSFPLSTDTSSTANTSLFAYRVLSGIRMLGSVAGTRTDSNQGERWIKRFQELNGLSVTGAIDASTLQKIDSLLVSREIADDALARSFPLFSHFATAPLNEPPTTHTVALYVIAFSALPRNLVVWNETNFKRYFGVQQPGVLKVLPNGDYQICDSAVNPEFGFNCMLNGTVSALPLSDFEHTTTQIHEYAHYLDGNIFPEAENTSEGIIDTDEFYNISFDVSRPHIGVEGWKFYPLRRPSNLQNEFVSGYAIGWTNGAAPSSEYRTAYEDFAESFAAYVTQGNVFRYLTNNNTVLQAKYNWLKQNVFLGQEYNTGDVAGIAASKQFPTSQGADSVATKAFNVIDYAVHLPGFIWNYSFPTGSTVTSTNNVPPVPVPTPLIITSISPSTITTGQSTNFTVYGTNLNSESRIYYTYRGEGSVPPGDFRPTFNLSLPDRLTFTTNLLPVGVYTFWVQNRGGQVSGNLTLTVNPTNTTTANDWVIVFTHREAEVPQEIRTFICGTALPTAVQWLEREAGRYGKTKPFSAARCIDQQVTLSGNLLNGGEFFTEGTSFNLPLNAGLVINLLEQDNRIRTAKFVTVIHYMENNLQFVNFAHGAKYDFGFIRKDVPTYYPALTVDNYSEEFIHELMHKVGASDKYDGVASACLTDPATGNEYSGYDIMCHRIGQPGGGYLTPPFSELTVTEPTASEIGWTNSGIPTPTPLPTPTAPTITSLSQYSVNGGDRVIINGSGFNSSSEVGYFLNGNYMGGTMAGSNLTISADGKRISFLVLSLPSGFYQLRVRNVATGMPIVESNPVNFTITSASTPITPPVITLNGDSGNNQQMTYSPQVAFGGTANLNWSVSPANGTTCAAAGSGIWGNTGSGEAGTSGSWTTPPIFTKTTYGIRCINSAGTTYKYVTIDIQEQPNTTTTASTPAPSITITPPSASIAFGGTATFGWDVTPQTADTKCYAAGTGLGGAEGYQEIGLTGRNWVTPALYTYTTYGIRCTNAGGTTYKYANVAVAAQQNTVTCTWNGGDVGQWGGGCNVFVGRTTKNSGEYSDTYNNTVSGYSGSIRYLCNSSGQFEVVASPCSRVAPKFQQFSQDPSSGSSVTVTWSADNADRCVVQYRLGVGGDWQEWTSENDGSGSVSATTLTSGTWQARAICTGPGGTTTSDMITHNVALSSPTRASQTAGVLGASSQGSDVFNYTWNQDLQMYSQYPEDIAALQTALAREGVYIGEITGGFYMQTYFAVKRFQEKYGIEATGFVGPQTRAKLNKLY